MFDKVTTTKEFMANKTILETFMGIIFDKVNTTKEFMTNIKKKFVNNKKVEINTFLTNLASMRYTKKSKEVVDTTL